MILQDDVRNAMLSAISTQLGTSPYIRFETSANAEIAVLPMSATPFAAPATGSMAANAIATDTTALAGTVTHASFYTSAAVKKFQLSVGTTGAEITISSTAIAANDQVSMSSLSILQPTGP